ncbi:MAG: spore coat protein U domain-containing protein [Bacteroidetes bacterium]|nr:spore coat protein U domain-containing protein [Bacteroidota bacterium]
MQIRRTFITSLIISLFILLFTLSPVFSKPPSLSIATPASVSIIYSYDTTTTVTDSMVVGHRYDPIEAAYGLPTGRSGNYYNRYVEDSNGNTISYQIYDNLSNRNVVTNNINSPTDWFYTQSYPLETSASSLEVFFSIEVPSGPFIPAGTYTDPIASYIYGDSGSGYVLFDSDPYVINIVVNSIAQIAIGATGFIFDELATSYSIDLLEIELNETATFDTIVLSNSAYSISMSSTNGGVLKHPLDTIKNQLRIPYLVSFNGGSNISLDSSETVVISGEPPTLSTGQRYPITITISDLPADLSAGDYDDTISLTVIAN